MARYTVPRETRFRRSYDQDIARTGAAGAALVNQFQSGIAEDPRQAYNTSISATIDMFRKKLGKDVRNLRGQQVGMGRLDTGFATEDEDRLFTESAQDFSRIASERALQAEGLNLDRLSMAGAYGDRMSERAMAARAGEFGTLRDQRRQDEADRRRGIGGLIRGGLTAAATFLPQGRAASALLAGVNAARGRRRD